MKTLIQIVREVYTQMPRGYKAKDSEQELIDKGFRLGSNETDPRTGAEFQKVENLANFGRMKSQLSKMRTELAPYKMFHDDENIKQTAGTIMKLLSLAKADLDTLDKYVKLRQQNLK